MREHTPQPRRTLRRLAIVALALLATGCSRGYYRNQADDDATRLIVNASDGTRNPLGDFSIAVNPQSRFFDADDPDHPPMPPDDPMAHELMHCVDCKSGYPCWHTHGDTPFVENPLWKSQLPLSAEGDVVVDLETAIDLGLTHSRDFQESLEDLYLSALDVSAERFRFDVQYFGGNDTFITGFGREQGGGQSLTTLDTTTDLGFNKLTASGGQLLVGFANNFVWQFAGNDTVSANSLLNFSLVQPLLRGGGKARVLERLTISERALLANVRAMERFRRGFYVEIATGTGGVAGPSRRGGFFGGSGLSGFTGIGGGGFGRVGGGGGGGGGGGFAGGAGAASAGGYLGILQDQRELRNQEANVASLQDSVELLDAFRQANRIDRFQVDLARQALYNAQSQLLTAKASYQSTLDGFKLDLGLPPDLPIHVQDDLLDPFELLSPELIALQTAGTDVLSEMWSVGQAAAAAEDAAGAALAIQNKREELQTSIALLESVQNLLELYRFRPNALPQDPATVARFQSILDDLISNQRRLLDASDPLRNYGEVMDEARELQNRALASLATVDRAVAALEESADRRMEILKVLSASEPVQSGEVDPSAFSVEVFQERRERLTRAYALISERLNESQDVWEGRRMRIEALQAPALAAEERVLTLTAPLRPLVERLEAAQAAVRDAELQDRDQANVAFFAVLDELMPQLQTKQQEMLATNASLEAYLTQAEGTLGETLQAVRRLADDSSEMGLIQARARLEAVFLPPQTLTEQLAMSIAREYRRDWMNARMTLVDIWRLIEFNANDLESNLDITFAGDLGTTDDNPFRFRDTNGSLSAGLSFDAPLQRLVERNVYRQALIEYQQAKRNYTAFVDGIQTSIRNILRTQELNVLNFELRRRSVHVAIDQVELTRLRLYEPPRPGETAAFGETTARDLVSALTDLLSVQNDFLSVWVNYEVQRMVMDLSLGTMELDEYGRWIDPGANLGNVPLSNDGALLQHDSNSLNAEELPDFFGDPTSGVGVPEMHNGEITPPKDELTVPEELRLPPIDSGTSVPAGAEPLRLQLPGRTAGKPDETTASKDVAPASYLTPINVKPPAARKPAEKKGDAVEAPAKEKQDAKRKVDPLFGNR